MHVHGHLLEDLNHSLSKVLSLILASSDGSVQESLPCIKDPIARIPILLSGSRDTTSGAGHEGVNLVVVSEPFDENVKMLAR